MTQQVQLFDDPTARRFHDLPAGVPGHFVQAEVFRAMQIFEAEAERHQRELRAIAVIKRAFVQHPDAANAGEALHRARLDAEFDQRVAEIPDADEVGMRWLIAETERSLGEGTFVRIPLR